MKLKRLVNDSIEPELLICDYSGLPHLVVKFPNEKDIKLGYISNDGGLILLYLSDKEIEKLLPYLRIDFNDKLKVR